MSLHEPEGLPNPDLEPAYGIALGLLGGVFLWALMISIDVLGAYVLATH